MVYLFASVKVSYAPPSATCEFVGSYRAPLVRFHSVSLGVGLNSLGMFGFLCKAP